ncbi:HEAT repeat domain-containing protein [Myxococcus sp. K15C18031901]|uniref:HEAT repeat domain-containing protein n=1 Tax=Myxococcus dinghuensis TaxID=2906761 RepID=UPI0020A7F34B|nr:HEAT repeat domain-containing protein [Myxococcus dinghuensis]MCP3103677.1 HEAT repeat domain-containing protein [Myxococcus dinghuensis]
MSRLDVADPEVVETALDVLGDALCGDEVLTRERAAQLLLGELIRPGARARGAILRLLQTSWWPPQEQLADGALDAVFTSVAMLDAEAMAVDDAAMLVANLYRAVPRLPLGTLEAALAHPKPAVRRAAAGAVGRVGKAAVSLLPKVLGVLDDVEPVAGAALESVGSMAALAPDLAMPALLEQVEKAEGARHYLALMSLRGLLEEKRREGRPAPELSAVEPALQRAAEDPQAPVRLEAVSLLGLARLSSLTTVATLRRHLQDESPSVAACAAVALLRVGAPPPEALSLLTGQLSAEGDPEKVGAALTALESVERPTLEKARSLLETVARDGQGYARESAREMLAQLA